jgi:hypothetical protein
VVEVSYKSAFMPLKFYTFEDDDFSNFISEYTCEFFVDKENSYLFAEALYYDKDFHLCYI